MCFCAQYWSIWGLCQVLFDFQPSIPLSTQLAFSSTDWNINVLAKEGVPFYLYQNIANGAKLNNQHQQQHLYQQNQRIQFNVRAIWVKSHKTHNSPASPSIPFCLVLIKIKTAHLYSVPGSCAWNQNNYRWNLLPDGLHCVPHIVVGNL